MPQEYQNIGIYKDEFDILIKLIDNKEDMSDDDEEFLKGFRHRLVVKRRLLNKKLRNG